MKTTSSIVVVIVAALMVVSKVDSAGLRPQRQLTYIQQQPSLFSSLNGGNGIVGPQNNLHAAVIGCPRIPRGSLGVCVDNCVSDNDCPIGVEKCCSNGCAMRCTGEERVRGQCPLPQQIPLSSCLNCPNCACSDDSQCKLGQKCCQSSCGQPICI